MADAVDDGAAESSDWPFVRHWWSGGVGGLIIGGMLIFSLAYSSVRWNNARVVSNITATATVIQGAGGGRVLVLGYKDYRDTGCPNQAEHILEQSKDNPDLPCQDPLSRSCNVWPIVPGTVNMLEKLGGDTQLDIHYEVPVDLPAGRWFYVARASDSCEVLPALTRTSIRWTKPVPVTIPQI